MTRSERFRARAIDRGLMAGVIFACSMCAGVWSVRAWQSAPAGGLVVFALALAGLCAAAGLAAAALRYARLAAAELEWETCRAIRPRL